jgi:class 3 adenylate cyclase/tetratricopeptide (TPR) repeat protein
MSAVCAGCGRENREGRKFCDGCGARLAVTCPRCGAVDPGERFCGECGTSLTSASTAALAGPTPAATQPATRQHEGERKQLTVLFADVQGSMDLQENLDPEVWATIMARLVQILAEGVRRFGGTVDKFTGDGIMALFGAPAAQEDHARRACQAAGHLITAIAEYAEVLRKEQGLELHVRLGLNSGEVVVGRVGDDVTLDPTALGHTVGLAQRMEARAEPGRAYMTEHTARLVQRWFRLEDLGPMAVKGAREALRVYALAGRASSTPTLEGGRVLGGTPLVGREREFAVLDDALALAIDGHAQVVGVAGEAGVGKSRLCDEFARACGAQGVTVRRASGLSHAQGLPFLPVLELLRDNFGITGAETPQAVREKITAHLMSLDPALEDALPLLFDFLEVPDPARPPPRMTGEVRMRRNLEILRRVTRRRSQREPLVLLLEDLHWFDTHSEAFLAELIPSYPGTRTLVLANFRPEFSASWMRHSYYRQISLQPLAPAAVDELLEALLGSDSSLTPLREHVIGRTAGNPFFIEEVVRALVEDGSLAGEPGAYRLARALADVRVPATVQAVLAARIDRLAERDKRVLQTASVIGRSFPEAVLRAVAMETGADPIASLRALCAAELLQEEAGAPISGFRFWHPLTQEVAYGSLLSERRTRLHAAVARALVDLDVERHDERAALIAAHFEAAADHHEASFWHARAASGALRTSMEESRRHWLATIAHLDKAAESEETLTLGVRARVHLLRLGSRRGIDPADAEALFAEGQALAKRLPDPGPLSVITKLRGSVQFWHGELRAGRSSFSDARDLLAQSTDLEAPIGAWLALAWACLYMGTVEEGLDLADEAITVCRGDLGRGMQSLGYSGLIRNLLTRGQLLALGGRLDAGRAEVNRALGLAREHRQVELQSWGFPIPAHLAYMGGEAETGLALAEEARRISVEIGNRFTLILALEALGIAQLAEGRHYEAQAPLTQALDEARTHRCGLSDEASVLTHLAEAHLAAGDGGAARRVADEAVETARTQGARILECLALLTRARVFRASGGEEANVPADLSAALDLVKKTGALVYEPSIREELGRLGGEEAELREALRLYEAIGATGHARRLEAELT